MQDALIKKILQAQIYDAVTETPLQNAEQLSQRTHNQVHLKREDLQAVFSFKIRGAYNRMRQLSKEQRQAGVIAASAGNHAQGIAYSGGALNIKTYIVMPSITPDIKINAVKQLGGEVIIHGDNFDQASAHAKRLMAEHGYTFIHPFDDLDVIAGQGTLGMEITRQGAPMDYVFVPIGGGGLAAGVGSYIKFIHPHTKIIGVEHEEAPSMQQALQHDERVVLDHVGTFADGTAVKQVGENTFTLCREVIDDIILVSTDETCAAIKDIFQDTRSVSEPAGALAVAGMKKFAARESLSDQRLCAICSGANVNFDRLRHVAERAEIGEGREALFAVNIPEQPGSFLRFCDHLGERSITEFNYRYADQQNAQVFAGVAVKNVTEKQALLDKFSAEGYDFEDLSDNEVAKVHLRFMVGGHAPSLLDEQLLRFKFPERPGALRHFLAQMSGRWNISLFHYRNHGSDFGRVLVGIQVPDSEQNEFEQFLQQLGFDYAFESQNPVYQRFLK